MSVDYGVEVVYGFKLDSKKIKEFISFAEQIYSDFNVYDWMEEEFESSCCEIVYSDHYRGLGDSDVYFGVVFYDRITAASLFDLEVARKEEVCDELIRVFGNYDILDDEQIAEPELHAVAQIY
jgi:hypothetical protein